LMWKCRVRLGDWGGSGGVPVTCSRDKTNCGCAADTRSLTLTQQTGGSVLAAPLATTFVTVGTARAQACGNSYWPSIQHLQPHVGFQNPPTCPSLLCCCNKKT
jgi:hypothetical protein